MYQIYVRFESSSIIKYLKQLTINVLTAHFIDCQSGQTILREKQMLRKEEILMECIISDSSFLSPYSMLTGRVQKIIHL